MTKKNTTKKIDIEILDISKTLSIFIGFSFFNSSFYHFENYVLNTIVGIVFFAYGLISIYVWNNMTEKRFKLIKWTMIIIFLVVIPMQIYTFISTATINNTSIKFLVLILNVCGDILVFGLLYRKKTLGRSDADE